MKFSTLLKKFNSGKLSAEDKNTVNSLRNVYSRLKLADKDKLSVEELRKIKSLREKYSGTRAKTSYKVNALEKFDDALIEANHVRTFTGEPQIKRMEHLLDIAPVNYTLSEIDEQSRIVSQNSKDYMKVLKKRINENTAFINDKKAGVRELKKFYGKNPTNVQIGLVNFIMKERGVAILDLDELEEYAKGFELIRELSETFKVKGYLHVIADTSLNVKDIGNRYIHGNSEDKKDVIKELSKIIKKK